MAPERVTQLEFTNGLDQHLLMSTASSGNFEMEVTVRSEHIDSMLNNTL